MERAQSVLDTRIDFDFYGNHVSWDLALHARGQPPRTVY